MEPIIRLNEECGAFFDRLWPGQQRPLVFGEGCAKSPVLMLIGEAPGQKEALEGRPFVGKAGKNLTEFLSVIGMARQDIYITNVVKIRPTKPGKAGGVINRPPTREETGLFTPWLMREIALVSPGALVTLGGVALRALLGESAVIGRCHGRWHMAVAAPPGRAAVTLPLFALYHPAAIIYDRALKDTYLADLERLASSLKRPEK